MSKYSDRYKEYAKLLIEIRVDIAEVLQLKGIFNRFVSFSWSHKPDRFIKIGNTPYGVLLVDNGGDEYHIDSLENINELLSILRGVEHIA